MVVVEGVVAVGLQLQAHKNTLTDTKEVQNFLYPDAQPPLPPPAHPWTTSCPPVPPQEVQVHQDQSNQSVGGPERSN